MKKNRFFVNSISLLLALALVAAVGAFSAFAVGEDEAPSQEGYSQTETLPEAQTEYVPVTEAPNNQPVYDNEPQNDQAGDNQPADSQPADNQAEREPMYEYIYGYSEDATSAYEAPQHLGELPEVSPSQVVEATAVAIPDVAVSDSTMLSGIVMWLCVALGIAVIVGVMVSKRTRRRGV